MLSCCVCCLLFDVCYLLSGGPFVLFAICSVSSIIMEDIWRITVVGSADREIILFIMRTGKREFCRIQSGFGPFEVQKEK